MKRKEQSMRLILGMIKFIYVSSKVVMEWSEKNNQW
jgi:hypothetical protein